MGIRELMDLEVAGKRRNGRPKKKMDYLNTEGMKLEEARGEDTLN